MPEYSSVKVIVTCGEVEVIYEIPQVKSFEMDTEYEEPEVYFPNKILNPPEIKSLVFTMEPVMKHQGAGRYFMTITQKKWKE